ncbi:hypothetical protein QDX21_03390 [Auritidibacter ignavus]|uniref:Uncharacterized protein n=1 Tax=Auritidibacter ignavus TaxID=678932 RepID=A0AAJ6DCN8_9MICC|nr:hypothetical protein [Auritidibacter ignavus]WGH93855.1 hypothetical protein QDX21_03390 [Auritidibacter ignavus]
MTPDEILGLPEGYLASMLTAPSHTLFVPLQQSGWVNTNHREHWAVRNRKTQEWRTATSWVARSSKIGPYQHISVTAHVHKTTNRAYDAHNLLPTAKAMVDGLVDAGVIPDDNNTYLTGPDMRHGKKQPDNPGITLHITATKE